MDIVEVLRNKIDVLQEYIDDINKDIEEDYNPEEWAGGNFDDCYEMGCSHGRRFGRMTAYHEILALLESEKY
ncbi:hypothetical protein HUB98_05590 [Paenibacillus barcinonensis]|uniref:Uncharacterized protein n=1 Tax=Paenibacillus barcinonensis TaxID=198119 RepID=A0A2V4W831_PAEBA|nr:hypothetical protein [Paenibacillus barcinonensis]PYE51463.1 hypothetical protein DFQ00_102257 [Paenibacillus barcinonensis]QKS55854.1 hypothetical protein HUB98_05590 [Paenibacillus barcinonensis]